MAQVPDSEFIPVTREQALSLLRALDDDTDLLSPLQAAAIRDLYRLNNDVTIESLCRLGQVRL